MNYDKKKPEYYSKIRLDLINLIDNKNLKVLEIGAAYGDTLSYLKQLGVASETVGIELFEDVSNKSRYKNLDKFIFGNINEIDLKEYDSYFDLILLPDVLEHIFDPLETLDRVHKILKNEGMVIVSMPNIRHYSAFINIFLKGDFKYEESGIFDYTHVKFYCKKNMLELFESANFKLIDSLSSIKNYNGKSVSKILNKLTFSLFEPFLTTQYFFKLRKK